MLVWVIGGKGLLGKALCASLEREGISFTSTDREDGDITSLDALQKKAVAFHPTHIVNCAAYTQVDLAESEKELAYQINATGPHLLALVANEIGAHLIHLSTDYVFDGTASRLLMETDVCEPINVYGMSKWEGEKNVLKEAPSACVIRTSWLFGKGGNNFLSNLVSWLQTQEEVQVVSDQINRPTYAPDLAEAIIKLLDAQGLYHFANGHPLSRFEMAQEILAMGNMKCRKVIPVTSEVFLCAAKRPLYTAMDTTKVSEVLGAPPRSWKEILTDYLESEVYAS